MTPAQAAESWPKLKALAQDCGLKIVSPAMNYGTMPGYENPTRWFEEFFGTDGNPGFPNVSLDDVDAIASKTITLNNNVAAGKRRDRERLFFH